MNLQASSAALLVDDLDGDARGVARREDGKVIFIADALPGEWVRYHSYRRKDNWEAAHLVSIERSCAQRVEPRCRYFGRCGGCALQHLEGSAQLATKARWLEDALLHIAKLRPQQWLPPLRGKEWGYRHRARLGVRYVDKKGGLLIGFREKQSRYLTDMSSCEVLHPRVSALLPVMRQEFSTLSIVYQIPQIEVAMGDNALALVLRVLQKPTANDEQLLHNFAVQQKLQIWLQEKGPDTATLLCDGSDTLLHDPLRPTPLFYRMPHHVYQPRDLELHFLPTDFTQVNHVVNSYLVTRALQLLDLKKDDKVLDVFCGIGNFTLPIALSAASVHGLEGSQTMIERARKNAAYNQLSARCSFTATDLFTIEAVQWQLYSGYNKILLDPPREGALQICKIFAQQKEACVSVPERIVYVSCNPATLARDAAILVHQAGYRLEKAGVINMFAHTTHIESIALFTRTASIPNSVV